MPDWTILLETAIAYGFGLSLVLTTIMIISGRIALDMWVGDYPPAIKNKYGPMSPRAARLRPYFAVLFFLAVLVVPIIGLLSLRHDFGLIPFIPAFAFSAVALLVFNTYDLVVLDWILFCTIQPRMMVLPGTEGMAAYHDYLFHLVGFHKGLGFCSVGGLMLAALWTVTQALAVWALALLRA